MTTSALPLPYRVLCDFKPGTPEGDVFRAKEIIQYLDSMNEVTGVGNWELDLTNDPPKPYWSKETKRIHGVAHDYEPVMDKALAFYDPEGQKLLSDAINHCLAGGPGWDFKLPMTRADGRRIWVRAVGSVEHWHGKPIRIFGALQDITEQIEHQRGIEEAVKRAKLATESAGMGVWDFDAVSNHLIWDDKMREIYGVDATTPIDYDLWRTILDPQDLPRIEQEMQKTLQGGAPFDTEFKIRHSQLGTRIIRATASTIREENGRPVRMIGMNWDITQLRELERDLRRQHEWTQTTLYAIGEAVIATNDRAEVIWINAAAERFLGCKGDAIAQLPVELLLSLNTEKTSGLSIRDVVRQVIDQRKEYRTSPGELVMVTTSRKEDPSWVEIKVSPIVDHEGEMMGTVIVLHDFTERNRMTQVMDEQSKTDSLTGLINRYEFERLLHLQASRKKPEALVGALLYMDLDQFKIINDTCGHFSGDRLLQQVALFLKSMVAHLPSAFLCRLGGDEFGIFLENEDLAGAKAFAQAICDQMDIYRFSEGDKKFRLGVSIGLVMMDQHRGDLMDAMRAADQACYAAKELGRNRYHVWSVEDRQLHERQDEMQWAARIEHAIDDGRFELYCQLIRPTHDDGVAGLHAEILLRMQGEDGHLFPPGAFLPAAERYNLSMRLDRWVINKTFEMLLENQSNMQSIELIAINISGQSIGDTAFHDQVLSLLASASPEINQRICFEITETAAITNIAAAAHFIKQVQAMGVKIALDDFGSGASSFGYLKNFSSNYLKIDGQFIRDIVDDPLDDAAVRCFIDASRIVGALTVAEFVENEAIVKRLKELGVDYLQGYLIHRPEPFERILQSLKGSAK